MQQTIESQRLILRPFTLTDAERVANLLSDQRISDMTANIPYPYSVSDAHTWIQRHSNMFLSGTGIVYAIVLKQTMEVIGTVSFPKIENGVGVLGYWLGVPFWGNGYATEASSLLVSYMKEHRGLRQLQVTHLADNARSRSVIKKLGVTYKGNQINHMQGKEREVCVYLSTL
ncbi:GNAT family N-acetyltransferase [Photobacterium leiognathi]|uniref:GNAT family N-acetyltransferase n=1 Tax=Photobacterium leiognathi TaxID=553611 RepID=UPI000D17075A|nr:GNAT family N-acetyltransferase [Photobacterium leiognathi]PSV01272.1 N-acetyltransferase [Photobacterium leiognathi subsp. mandapamensis]